MWSKTYPPILPYFGSKQIIASDVWRWFGRPRTYCEPFCGSAKMLFARPKSSLPKGRAIEIINDTNGYVANAWRAIKYAKDEVAEYVINLYSEVDVHARHAWLINNSEGLVPRLEGDPAYHSPRIAGYWIWGMSAHIGQGFASGRGPWNLAMDDEGYQVLVNIGDENAGISRQLPSVTWRGVITLEPDEVYAVLDRYASRLRDVMVVCGDWTRVVTTGVLYNTPAAIFCLHPDTPIRMEHEELVPVKDIRQGDVLHGRRTVNSVMLRRCYNEKMLRISIQGMPDDLMVTPEHRIPRIPGRKSGRQDKRSDSALWNSLGLVSASDLEIGDYLLVPQGGQERVVEWFWDDSLRRHGTRQKKVFFHPTGDIWRLLGYYAAEGRIVYSKRGSVVGVNFTFSRDEEHTYVADVVSIVSEVFGVEATLRWHNNGAINVFVGSAPVAKFFSHYVPGRALTKRLHSDLMTLGASSQLEILVGWMRGDGGMYRSSRNRCKLTGTTSSNALGRQMFTISIRCGLKPSFKTRRNSGYTNCFDVYFASEDAKKLGWSVEAKKFRSSRRVINGHYLVRVRSITEELYDGIVYDLDVDSDDMFGAPYVLVHNCDPPYRDASRKSESTLYASDGDDIAKEVEVWAIENGDNPDYRIALCGYEGDYDMPDGWNVIEWTANRGFSVGESPRDKERVWLSPHCATNEHKQLSLLDGG